MLIELEFLTLLFVNVALKDKLQIISCFVAIDIKMPEISWKYCWEHYGFISISKPYTFVWK